MAFNRERSEENCQIPFSVLLSRRLRDDSSAWGPWEEISSEGVKLYEYEKFRLELKGPKGFILHVDGLDEMESDEIFEWSQSGALWFPGVYQMKVKNSSGEVQWLSRLQVNTRQKFQQFGPFMMETLEQWIAGVTVDPEVGILAHSSSNLQLANREVKTIEDMLMAARRLILMSDYRFLWEKRRLSYTNNISDNQLVLHILRWLQQFITMRQLVLSKYIKTYTTFMDQFIQLTRCQEELTWILNQSFWDDISVDSGVHSFTGRALHLKHYHTIAKGFAFLQHNRSWASHSSSMAAMERVRATPKIFELWLLYHLLKIFQQNKWILAEAPFWYKFGRKFGLVDPVPLENSQFKLKKEQWMLSLAFDTELPHIGDDKDQDGLWMSGPHNRPDFLLTFKRNQQITKALVIEAKYRPFFWVWDSKNPKTHDTMYQLLQYNSSLMCDRHHLDPMVICALPELQEPLFRPTKYSDITFIRTSPTILQDDWQIMLQDLILDSLRNV
ncbi:hypothetical protein BFX06_12165 [Sulfobacillus thermosulfidooxidans]|uniref:hypothetical protein n=3 Tax=Sulfobacillus thermosulfidooxidans TaxID=28034 RepID=UPI00096B7991|nr:hypothetical protein [Sulfobacillus thermosulfidooxidans]OLZ17891.1 hypothetical protein BFX06_12165 [Sulfobacillus thermosulfidooxidans]OLZ21656.1 hypothetical protein BFX07_12595 [Sulfobacillus thermosulfidooxidans]